MSMKEVYELNKIIVDKENLSLKIENSIEKNSDCVMPFLSEISLTINKIQKYLYKKVNKNKVPPLILLNFRVNEDSMKITPYLLEKCILNAVSKACGTVDILSLDFGDMHSKAFYKYTDISKFQKLLKNIELYSNKSHKELVNLIDENNANIPTVENPNVLNSQYVVNIKNKLQILFKIDVLSIYEKYGEAYLFELLNCLSNSESIKGIILDSSIKTYENSNMKSIEFNTGESKRKLIKSLEIINKYRNSNNSMDNKNDLKSKLMNKSYDSGNNNEVSKRLKIITNDGVLSSKDILNYYKLGADLVLFSTLFSLKSPFIFETICEELKNEYLKGNNK